MSEWLMTTEEGKMKMREFSDDHMCRLFEKFVLEYYKKHHPELKPCAAQIDWNVEKEQSSMNILPIMQTDILLTMEERTLIIDTKYYTQSMQKQYDKVTIHSNNLYQINTYVTEYDKEHKGNVDGMLLYAKTQEEIVPDDSIKKKDGNIIYFKTLDLNIDFDSIKKRLDSFVCSYKGDI
jgi:5-methylcytosine-specific restriction enzyme subunit McrC